MRSLRDYIDYVESQNLNEADIPQQAGQPVDPKDQAMFDRYMQSLKNMYAAAQVPMDGDQIKASRFGLPMPPKDVADWIAQGKPMDAKAGDMSWIERNVFARGADEKIKAAATTNQAQDKAYNDKLARFKELLAKANTGGGAQPATGSAANLASTQWQAPNYSLTANLPKAGGLRVQESIANDLAKLRLLESAQVNEDLTPDEAKELDALAAQFAKDPMAAELITSYQAYKNKPAPTAPDAAAQPETPKPKQLLPVDPKVQELQKKILAKYPDALPKYGADGRMGPETQAALKKYPEFGQPAGTPQSQANAQDIENGKSQQQSGGAAQADIPPEVANIKNPKSGQEVWFQGTRYKYVVSGGGRGFKGTAKWTKTFKPGDWGWNTNQGKATSAYTSPEIATQAAAQPTTSTKPPAPATKVEPMPASTMTGNNQAVQDWYNKYGKTHNPDGTPKAVKESAYSEDQTLARIVDLARR